MPAGIKYNGSLLLGNLLSGTPTEMSYAMDGQKGSNLLLALHVT